MTDETREAMILAGGLGSRLRAAVADRPKPMAEVAGRPFITFLLDQLVRYGFQRAILCVGHMGEYVPPVLGDRYGTMGLVYSFEQIALGTGGALRNAAALVSADHVIAMNGDSFCDVDLHALDRAHHGYGAMATIAVLPQSDRRRAGAVTLDASGRVTAFESRPAGPTPGLINAGVYVLRRDVLDLIPPELKVSLEDEIFPALAARRELFGWQVEGRFIDIGTPESYDAAQAFF
jgi:D-glycero-alpha-D-manno-heptose 1-phosphate guanylyltransferase